MRGLICQMRLAQYGVQRAMPSHEKEHASGRGDASQKAREEAQDRAKVGERAHPSWESGLLRE